MNGWMTRIVKVLEELTGQAVQLTPDENLFTALGIDSVQVILLVSMLEQEFEVQFGFDDLPNMVSLSSIADMVIRQGGV
ncbi:MAG: acyl carrier protein [Magnetococcales bacterium]|nr:acyl carrier protein [Magnetococcales bacterium]